MLKTSKKLQRAIILAAGMGTRLQSMTLDKPKCLLPFAGQTILEYQIAQLRKNDIADIVVVIGYEAGQVIRILPAGVRYVINPDYQKTNSLYSLFLARENLDQPLLLLNGDVIYDDMLMTNLIEHPSPDVLLVDFDKPLAKGEMNVCVRNGRVVKIGKHIAPAEADGESAQIVKFGFESAVRLKKELEECVSNGQVYHFPSDLYHVIINQSGLSFMKTGGLPWFELDTPEDYLRLCRHYENCPLDVQAMEE